MNRIQPKLLIVAFIIFAFARVAPAQTTAFTYQGRLSDSAAQANGTYDLGFALFNAQSGGTQIGAAQTRAAVTVTNGVFTVQLDFGAAAFPGANRYLEIAVKRPADQNFTTLAPRQPVTSTPYAIQSLNATNADTATNATNAANSQQLGGTAASSFVRTDSNAFVRNQNTTQSAASFNIFGTGTAGSLSSRSSVRALSGFDIGSDRVLFVNEYGSTFVGRTRAMTPSFGVSNTFVGDDAGRNNTASSNTFVGDNAGIENNTGGQNSFFGAQAGASNVGGINNAYFGDAAGKSSTGNFNVFFGSSAGGGNRTGGYNTTLGAQADVGASDLTFATAIGARAVVRASNTIALGRENGNDTVLVYGAITTNGSLSVNGDASISGGLSLNSKPLRLRASNDNNHFISYNPTINGIEFRAGDEFIWSNVRFNNVSMALTSTGDLRIRGSYQQFSDARYKTGVQTFPSALDAVRRLRGVTFNWKPGANPDSNRQIGFIAQEVEAVLPEIVSTDKEGYKTVAYANAVPVLVEAVKEQQTEIEAKQHQLDALQKRVEQQQTTIDALKTLLCAGNAIADICRQP